MPIHVSNVQIVDPKSGKPTRIKVSRDAGSYTRVAQKSGARLA
jgi:large subunit ribosomal protein L24